MTVTYSLDVSTSGMFTFAKVLFRWRGSVWKALYREIILFLVVYYAISLSYRFAFSEEQKDLFDIVSLFVNKYLSTIPLNFLLGFYVTIVYNRWWQNFWVIGWPESTAMFVSTHLHGDDEMGRIMRRTIIRYCHSTFVLGMRACSIPVKKRFPTLDHMVEAGLLTPEELKIYEAVPSKYPKAWIPTQWACSLCVRARREGRITSDYALFELIRDWMSIPLVYTQVVTLAVYSYFACCTLGRQYLEAPAVNDKDKHLYFDFYFPLFTLLEFVFFVGWLKVAEVMINPWGEDDDDFEVNFLVERNIQVSFTYVDYNYGVVPPLERDIFWDTPDFKVPHTAASKGRMDHSTDFQGSVKPVRLTGHSTDVIIEDEDEGETEENSVVDEETLAEPTVLRKITSFIAAGTHFHLGPQLSNPIPSETQLRKVSSFPVELSSVSTEPKSPQPHHQPHHQSHFSQKSRRPKFYHSARHFHTRPVRKFSHLHSEDETPPTLKRNSFRASRKSSNNTEVTVLGVDTPKLLQTPATPDFSESREPSMRRSHSTSILLNVQTLKPRNRNHSVHYDNPVCEE